ncbi:MAG: MATE family efflux transporter [Bryobacteraceae bacterium]
MRLWPALREQAPPVLRLAIPLVVGELGWMTMGLVDTMMVGRLSKEAMGGVSVAGILFYTVATFGMGVLCGLDTLVSQAFGAEDIDDCHRWLVSGLWLAAALVAPSMLVAAAWAPLMRLAGVHRDVLPAATEYIYAVLWSLPPLYLYTALRRYLQARNLVGGVMFSLVSANLINAGVNWLLIFGHWGFPRMGAAGAGWATTISRAYMALCVAAYLVWKERLQPTGLTGATWRPNLDRIRRVFALGLPAGLQVVFEVAVWAIAGTLAARLDPRYIAAHQIAVTAASYSFMVPLGISSAAAVRVGQLLGANDGRGAAAAGWVAILIGVAFMGCAGAYYVLAPRAVGRLLTNDSGVVETAAGFLAWVAMFQLFDGAQAVATGALRGAGNTRAAAIAHLVGYWLIGLPAGYWLCFFAGWGAAGLWAGLCLALVLIGVALAGAWWRTALGFASYRAVR